MKNKAGRELTTKAEMKFKVSAWESDDHTIEGVEFTADVATAEEAREIAASFPKYLKVYGGKISGSPLKEDGTTDYMKSLEWGYVSMKAFLTSDGVNKGANETGMKRVKKFASMVKCEYHAPYGNSVSKARVEALIKGGK